MGMDSVQDKGNENTESYYYVEDLVEVHFLGEEGQSMSKV